MSEQQPPRKRSSGGRGNRGRPPRDRGSGRGSQPSNRRKFPKVQITVACEEKDLERLTTRYRVLEYESTAAGPLTERAARNLVERTPDGFVVDVRAHRLLTQHSSPADALWPEVRDRLPQSARGKPVLFPDELPATVLDAALDRFVASIAPLQEFSKLGAVIFQFPSYFTPSSKSRDYLVWLRERCGDLRLAIELRRREWLNTKHRDETLSFLEEHKLIYVCVDAPQGVDTSVPPIAPATSPDLAIVRLHGRDLATWERNVDDPLARARYEYRRADLEPWVSRLEKLAAGGRTVHAIMTTAPVDGAGRSASLLVKVLTEPPDAKPSEPTPRTGPPKRRRF
jgi:uncharacterized protein YecE (DUF72 family)